MNYQFYVLLRNTITARILILIFDINIVKEEDLRLYNKQTPWPLVRERTIPTERRPLVHEI
jgi:hypothetical protein